MINKIDLRDIFNFAWGFSAPPFPEIVAGMITREKGSFSTEALSFSLPEKESVSQKGVTYRAINRHGGEIFMPIWLSETKRDALEYMLPNSVMYISSKKNVVTEPLANGSGTFKEEVGMDDWEIRIRGVLVGENDNYPEADKQMLVDWYKKRKTLDIQNAKTAICFSENEKVFIADLSFPESKFENAQPYEMKLLSDLEFKLYID